MKAKREASKERREECEEGGNEENKNQQNNNNQMYDVCAWLQNNLSPIKKLSSSIHLTTNIVVQNLVQNLSFYLNRSLLL